MPKNGSTDTDYADTILPEDILSVPTRYAINWCNRWMLRQSDFVVTYITHNWGGAAKFAQMAARLNKKVIHLSHIPENHAANRP